MPGFFLGHIIMSYRKLVLEIPLYNAEDLAYVYRPKLEYVSQHVLDVFPCSSAVDWLIVYRIAVASGRDGHTARIKEHLDIIQRWVTECKGHRWSVVADTEETSEWGHLSSSTVQLKSHQGADH